MFKLEFHAAEGGKDAELFAFELASAVASYSDLTVKQENKIVSLTADHRL